LLRTVALAGEPLGHWFGVKPMVTRDALDFLMWQARVDASKARAALGYEQMPLEEGVRRTVESLRA
jgi:dihydroflavonol-4-reductase